ncbi:uncharacterized protein [Ptychodera flava]|uniref:uncharacterized protein n=1 Tax=Ptychodera flava TaxID=63121 RepID=UPI00396A2FEE
MEELLRRCIGDFMMKASLPVKEIYYSISDILYVNEKAETKGDISDDDKRSMLIGILLNTMLKPEEFEKCSKVFAPYLNVKPIEEGSSGRSTETFHQQLLSNYKDELARDLPYQKVFDKMQDVFSLKENQTFRRRTCSVLTKVDYWLIHF